MTTQEFISLIQSRGAVIFPASTDKDIIFANTNLQNMRAAMLPKFMQDLYKTSSAITLGSACIFGPQEIQRGIKYPLPSIIDINKSMTGTKNLFGKTVFGRNDLFWFVFDAFGNCFMLDNLTLTPLRKYDDPYRAMLDCLIIGKI
nr:hypothetical protein [Candidatus Enterousia merdequi]